MDTVEERAGGKALVRKATAADVPQIVRTLTRAFHDDPVMSFIFPEDGKRPACLDGDGARVVTLRAAAGQDGRADRKRAQPARREDEWSPRVN